jgi:phage gp37-like protein
MGERKVGEEEEVREGDLPWLAAAGRRQQHTSGSRSEEAVGAEVGVGRRQMSSPAVRKQWGLARRKSAGKRPSSRR